MFSRWWCGAWIVADSSHIVLTALMLKLQYSRPTRSIPRLRCCQAIMNHCIDYVRLKGPYLLWGWLSTTCAILLGNDKEWKSIWFYSKLIQCISCRSRHMQTLNTVAKCKNAVTPLLTHWSYCSLALSRRIGTITNQRNHVGITEIYNQLNLWLLATYIDLLMSTVWSLHDSVFSQIHIIDYV